MDKTIEIDGREYNIGPMDVFVQFHVARRLGPLAPTILNWFQIPKEERELMDLFYPLMSIISTLSDNDSDYILHQCLSTVTIKDGSGWAKIKNGNSLQYNFITMSTMLKLTWEVIQKDIVSFFPSVPESSVVKNQQE